MVAQLESVGSDAHRDLLGFDEPAFVEPHVCEQAESPTTPDAITQLLELVRRKMKPDLSEVRIAREECHPGLMLTHPRPSPTVIEELREGLGFTEQQLGVRQRATKDLGKATFA